MLRRQPSCFDDVVTVWFDSRVDVVTNRDDGVLPNFFEDAATMCFPVVAVLPRWHGCFDDATTAAWLLH